MPRHHRSRTPQNGKPVPPVAPGGTTGHFAVLAAQNNQLMLRVQALMAALEDQANQFASVRQSACYFLSKIPGASVEAAGADLDAFADVPLRCGERKDAQGKGLDRFLFTLGPKIPKASPIIDPVTGAPMESPEGIPVTFEGSAGETSLPGNGPRLVL